jgi:hypothetical protein
MRIQPTPLRVERDRRFFMCYTHLEGVPDLSSRAADAQLVRPGSIHIALHIVVSTSNAAPFDISAFSSEKSAG